MGAFSIAFDIVIVSALALPWVLLVIHLFFSKDESGIKSLIEWVNKQNQPAVTGVLLFGMAFSLGSAVSRIAQDFFDDDDLHVPVFDYQVQVGVTETSLRTNVYCQTLQRGLLATKKVNDPLAQKREKFSSSDPECDYTGRWIVRHSRKWIDDQKDLAGDDFHVQEAAVLLKGTDDNERLRQFHDQIIVLRGAAFNGMLAFSLCLFWWSAQKRSWMRWAVVFLFLVPGVIASVNHFADHGDSPPYMEFTLLTLAVAGYCVLRSARNEKDGAGNSETHHERGNVRVAYLVLSLFLTFTAFLGWWATQVLYDQQVIYSYQAIGQNPVEVATPSPK